MPSEFYYPTVRHNHYCWSCDRTWECFNPNCASEKENTCPLCDRELDGDEDKE